MNQANLSVGPGRIVVVAGTDTGVGKTWLGCAVARALRGAGHRVTAVKPVESGCGLEMLPDEDGARLAEATGQSTHATLVRLRAPLAPAIAAAREGVTLDPRAWVAAIARARRDADVVLVEGAGGLLSPLTWEWSVVDLAQATEASVLLVAANRLGAIGQVRLCRSALDGAGLACRGVALVDEAAPDGSSDSNAPAIARLTASDRVVVVPRFAGERPHHPSIDRVARWLLD